HAPADGRRVERHGGVAVQAEPAREDVAVLLEAVEEDAVPGLDGFFVTDSGGGAFHAGQSFLSAGPLQQRASRDECTAARGRFPTAALTRLVTERRCGCRATCCRDGSHPRGSSPASDRRAWLRPPRCRARSRRTVRVRVGAT